MIKICLHCGKEFKTFPCRMGKFCSPQCAGLHYSQSLVERNKSRGSGSVDVLCAYCGKKLKRTKKYLEKYPASYCSFQCKGLHQIKHITKQCPICGKQFEVHPSDEKKSANGGIYCSQKCAKIAQSVRQCGENNPCWKGGITTEYTLIRTSPEARKWRKAVFKRDNWACQACGKIGGKLNAHHIKSFAEHPDLRFEEDNGITLCVKCHGKFHRENGKPKGVSDEFKRYAKAS